MFRHRFSAEDKKETPEFRKFILSISTAIQQWVADADQIDSDMKKFRTEMQKAGFDSKDEAYAIPLNLSESLYKEMIELQKEVVAELKKANSDYLKKKTK